MSEYPAERPPKNDFELRMVATANEAPREDERRTLAMDQFIEAVGQKILGELRRLPATHRMDALDIDLYVTACKGIRTNDHLDGVCRALRSNCEFRPVPAKFRLMVEEVIGVKHSERDTLGDGQRAAYVVVTAPPDHQIEGLPLRNTQESGREHFERIRRWQREHLCDPMAASVKVKRGGPS